MLALRQEIKVKIGNTIGTYSQSLGRTNGRGRRSATAASPAWPWD